MSFCPHCGSKVNENSTFCGNCGNQIKESAKTKKEFRLPKSFETAPDFDAKKIFNKIKGYLSHFYIDYNSLFFKWAMIIFLAIGIGKSAYNIVRTFLPKIVLNWFGAADALYRLGFCLLLFGVFSLILLKRKEKCIIKKSNIFRIFWIITVVLNLLVFIVGINLYQYILYSNIAREIITILMVASSALLLYKNRPKYPIALVITLLSLALQNSSLWGIKFTYSFYKINNSFENFAAFFNSGTLGFIMLVVLLFLTRYFIPEKISKWIVYIPTLLITANSILSLVEHFSVNNIINFIIDVAFIIMFLLFALSCSRKCSYDYTIENEEKSTKGAIKVGVISLSSVIAITLVYLLVTAIICSVQINSAMTKWKDKISDGSLTYSFQWDNAREDLFKYNSTKLATSFINDYSAYKSIKENIEEMEKISVSYKAYELGIVNTESAEEYADIEVSDYWRNDPVLSAYYEMYMEMKPDIEKVSAKVSINVDRGQITVTVTNNNYLPISECNVRCNFTIGYIRTGYYSNIEYGRGSRYFTIEDISGKSQKTETFDFDPHSYYDGYSSYLMAFLQDSSISVQSIE